jgi:phosphate/sulfate permease
MAGVKDLPPAENAAGRGAGPRNAASLVSLASSVVAIFFALMFLHLRSSAFRGAFLIAVPAASVLAIICGVVGLGTARRTGIGRAEAWWGLSLSICTLLFASIIGLLACELSRLPSNAF